MQRVVCLSQKYYDIIYNYPTSHARIMPPQISLSLQSALLTQQIGKLCELRKCQCLAADALRKPHLPKCFYNRILAD